MYYLGLSSLTPIVYVRLMTIQIRLTVAFVARSKWVWASNTNIFKKEIWYKVSTYFTSSFGTLYVEQKAGPRPILRSRLSSSIWISRNKLWVFATKAMPYIAQPFICNGDERGSNDIEYYSEISSKICNYSILSSFIDIEHKLF